MRTFACPIAVNSPPRPPARHRSKRYTHAELLESRVLLSAVGYVYNLLASFEGPQTGQNGATPYTVAWDNAGNIVGMTAAGGPNRFSGISGGTVYKLVAGAPPITTVLALQPQQGFYGHGNIAKDAAGNLYGTIVNGGAFGDGSVFKVSADLSTIVTLDSFNIINGQAPVGGVILDAAGNAYGTTSHGGLNDDGTIFELPAGSNQIVTLATFNGSNGSQAIGTLLIDAAGNLYGAAQTGGSEDYGTVFELPAGTHTIVTLAQFNKDNGAYPTGNVVLDAGGNLYGTTSRGGGDDVGTIFKIPVNSGTITTLFSFTGSDNGSNPLGTLLMDNGGNLLGVTGGGGANNDGTVWMLPAGASNVTILYAFAQDSTGLFPSGALAVNSQGQVAGTTIRGGLDDFGTVFEMTVVTSNFVPNLYGDIFGRAPDAAGLAYWNSQLAAGMSPLAVAAAFISSPEHRLTQITAYYHQILNRDPDAAGLAYWTNFLATGGTVEQLQATLYGSQEFENQQGGVNGAIQAMYLSILDRNADPAGVTFWSDQVAAGMTLTQVATNILLSPEKSMQRVEGIYEFYLLRDADPGGMAYWSSQLEAGVSSDTVVALILGTPEYYSSTIDRSVST